MTLRAAILYAAGKARLFPETGKPVFILSRRVSHPVCIEDSLFQTLKALIDLRQLIKK